MVKAVWSCHFLDHMVYFTPDFEHHLESLVLYLWIYSVCRLPFCLARDLFPYIIIELPFFFFFGEHYWITCSAKMLILLKGYKHILMLSTKNYIVKVSCLSHHFSVETSISSALFWVKFLLQGHCTTFSLTLLFLTV